MSVNGMSMARVLISFSVLVVFFIVGVFDVWASASGNSRNTVSATIQDWSSQIPAIPFLCGAIAAHLFWPHKI